MSGPVHGGPTGVFQVEGDSHVVFGGDFGVPLVGIYSSMTFLSNVTSDQIYCFHSAEFYAGMFFVFVLAPFSFLLSLVLFLESRRRTK